MVRLQRKNFMMDHSLFNVLINRSNEEFGENEEGVQYSQPIEFYFLRDDLTEKKGRFRSWRYNFISRRILWCTKYKC